MEVTNNDGSQRAEAPEAEITSSAVGSWGEPGTRGEPSLELSDDGRVTGSDGCNRLMGGYTEEAGVVTFMQLASTMMFCAGVDTWLTQAVTARVVDGALAVYDGEQTQIGTLARAEDA